MKKLSIDERIKLKKLTENAGVGDTVICCGCGYEFVKNHKNRIFCTRYKGTKCKDKYWNNIIPEKRCNTTRISPASSRWMASRSFVEHQDDYDYYDDAEIAQGIDELSMCGDK